MFAAKNTPMKLNMMAILLLIYFSCSEPPENPKIFLSQHLLWLSTCWAFVWFIPIYVSSPTPFIIFEVTLGKIDFI